MARITTSRRKALPSSEFGLSKTRQYPLDTAHRAANAKGRADQQLEAGNLTHSQYDEIIRKANRKLGKGRRS